MTLTRRLVFYLVVGYYIVFAAGFTLGWMIWH
jgi:hypothetical protein